MVGILPELTMRPALAQQIPALIKRPLERAEPLPLEVTRQLAAGNLVAEFVLLPDKVADLVQDLRVVHNSTVSAAVSSVRRPVGGRGNAADKSIHSIGGADYWNLTYRMRITTVDMYG